MTQLASGALAMAYLVAGLFFLRYWRRTKDSLFIYFTVAFWILAAQRLAIDLAPKGFEHDLIFYIARLAAFVILLLGIWSKNREP